MGAQVSVGPEAARDAYRDQITKLGDSAVGYLNSPKSKCVFENADKCYDIAEELLVHIGAIELAHTNLINANKNVVLPTNPEDAKRECQLITKYEIQAKSVLSRLEARLTNIRSLQEATRGRNQLTL